MKPIQELFSLKGKVALVTGAAKGIGQAIAMRLAEAGAKVALTDVDQEGLNHTVALIRKEGGTAEGLFDDTGTIDDAAQVVKAVAEIFGDLHILVNNAGIFKFMPVLSLTEKLWDDTLNINLKGAAFLSKEAANLMIANGHGGRIINISSIDAFHPTGNLSHYDASKGGLEMLTKSMAKELAPHGILVNSIAPGGVSTPGTAVMTGNMSEEEKKMVLEGFLATLPLRRMGEPEEIANAALFLASEASTYMVGSTIVVDGGALIK